MSDVYFYMLLYALVAFKSTSVQMEWIFSKNNDSSQKSTWRFNSSELKTNGNDFIHFFRDFVVVGLYFALHCRDWNLIQEKGNDTKHHPILSLSWLIFFTKNTTIAFSRHLSNWLCFFFHTVFFCEWFLEQHGHKSIPFWATSSCILAIRVRSQCENCWWLFESVRERIWKCGFNKHQHSCWPGFFWKKITHP